ncbi:MAG: hypothetical protein ABL999_18830 [Pyrinomonadaceae bacterium]
MIELNDTNVGHAGGTGVAAEGGRVPVRIGTPGTQAPSPATVLL